MLLGLVRTGMTRRLVILIIVSVTMSFYFTAVLLMRETSSLHESISVVKRHLRLSPTTQEVLQEINNLADNRIKKDRNPKEEVSQIKDKPHADQDHKKAEEDEKRRVVAKQAVNETFQYVDYDKIVPRAPPDAPGEMNAQVIIDPDQLSPEERKKFDELFDKNGFSQYVSDMISVRRTLPDFREETCHLPEYRGVADLPDVSVVIAVYNEAWSALVRTVHSVLDNSPQQLIKEIILAVDQTDYEELHKPLDDYMAKLGKVTVLHSDKRLGLTRARLMGYTVATGKVLVFLDSHCECTEGWLEPLLDRIAGDRTICVMPSIDGINSKTFSMVGGTARNMQVGGFDWNMQFSWHPIPNEDWDARKYITDPIRSPTMPGGLFAIDREFFTEIGAYDPGHEDAFWGGENVELSFKIWMCGGSMEIVPCSHVGHIFRDKPNYKYGQVHLNSFRVAEVWLQEYKQLFYQMMDTKNVSFGDVTKQLQDRTKCKSFDWYVKNIYPGVFLPQRMHAYGEIRNRNLSSTCIDASLQENRSKPPLVYKCQQDSFGVVRPYFSQYWYLSPKGEIMRSGACLDFATHIGHVVLTNCHGQGGNQYFIYRDDGTIQHRDSKLCLEATPTVLNMTTCQGHDLQIWTWERNPQIII